MSARLKLLLFDSGGGLWLFLRLPGGRRLLFDCQGAAPGPALDFLRRQGELGPQRPLSGLERPWREPRAEAWLALLGLVRGLVLRPGGAWLHWRDRVGDGQGFALQARVGGPPRQGGWQGSLLALGLDPEQVVTLGGGPAECLGNASLALLLPGAGGDLLLGGELSPSAWGRLLAAPATRGLLGQVARYGQAAALERPDLGASLVGAALPWLLAGAGASAGRELSLPRVGALRLAAEDDGLITARGWPRGDNLIHWPGRVRALDDATEPAPEPLRRALAA